MVAPVYPFYGRTSPRVRFAEPMSVDWNWGEAVAWIVLAISVLYLADWLVTWLVTRFRGRPRVKPGK